MRVYKIFYFLLVLFLMVCVLELYSVLFLNRVRKKNTIPILQVQPMADSKSKRALIVYDENDINTVDTWIYLIDKLLEVYKNYPESQNTAPLCNFHQLPKLGQNCPIDLDHFGPCTPPYYGYYSISPCVFLKLSKVSGWLPIYYNISDGLPSDMPEHLIKEIHFNAIQNTDQQVWISCEGEHDLDKENIQTFNYYPGKGFPSYFFPMGYHSNGYLTPLMAVEIVNPQPGVIINIECRIWAKNLEYIKDNSGDARGSSVLFSLMRDEFSY